MEHTWRDVTGTVDAEGLVSRVERSRHPGPHQVPRRRAIGPLRLLLAHGEELGPIDPSI